MKVVAQTRTGVALLMVLGVILMITASVTVISTSWRRERIAVSYENQLSQINIMVHDAESYARIWLRENAQNIVTKSSNEPQGVTILRDYIQTEKGEGNVQIDCYDACAGLSMQHLREGNAQRYKAHLPMRMQRLTRRRSRSSQEGDWWIEEGRKDDRRFPQPIQGEWSKWSDSHLSQRSGESYDKKKLNGCIGEVLWLSPYANGKININTVPDPLLRALCEYKDIQAIENILRARQNGRKTSLQDLLSLGQNEFSNDDGIELVDSSTVWYALVTCSWNQLQRTYFIVIDIGTNGQSVKTLTHIPIL